MSYELGLIASIAICFWVGIDALLLPRTGRHSPPLGCLVLCAGLWTTGSLLLNSATAPEEWLFARRVLFAGACFIGPCFVWMALRTARPSWWLRRRRLLALPFAAGAFFYSTSFWAPTGWFVDWHLAGVSSFGPVFALHTALSWSCILLGAVYLAGSVRGASRETQVRIMGMLGAIALPFVGNVLYLALRPAALPPGADPTPFFLGIGALGIHFTAMRAGVSLTLPLGRHQVIDQIELGVVLADVQGRIVDANGTAHTLLGRERLSELSFDELVDEARHAAGRKLEVRDFPVRGPAGVVGRGAIIADRSREARAERRLHLAARLETVGSMTAGIAHEVNNPLAFIRSNLVQLEKIAFYLAEQESIDALPRTLRSLASDAPELVAETRDGIERIARLVEQLRGFARDEGQQEPGSVSLASVVPRAVTLARAGRPVESISMQIEEAPEVCGSDGDVVQIVLNLLLNALQALAPDEAGAPIEVQVMAQDKGAAVRVLDRGPGFSDGALRQVFDPFFTTKPDGTGLGLSLSYELAQRFGGHLEAANRLDGGAVVVLWLPAAVDN